MSTRTHSRILIPALMIASGMSSLSYGVMFTVLDDFRNDFGIQESRLGIIIALGFLMSFVSQILIAPYADRGHARRLVTIGYATEALGCFVVAMGSNFPVIALGRVLMGLGAGTATPAVRRIVVLADKENVGRNLGRVLSVDVAGFALGPILSALTVGHLGLPAPFIIVGVLSVVAVLVIRNLGIEEQPEESRTSSRLAFDLLRNRPLAGAVMLSLGLMIMIGTFDSTWSVMMDDLGASSFIANLGISVFALPLVVLGPIGGRLTQRVGPFIAASAGLMCGSLFMTAYGNLGVPLAMLMVGVCHGVVDGLTVMGSGIAVSMVAPQDRLASAQGLMGGLSTLMGGVSAVIAGFNYDTFGRRTTFMFTVVMMLVIVVWARQLAGSSFTMRHAPDAPSGHPATVGDELGAG